MDILRIKEEMEKASRKEAYDIAIEKMAEGIFYAETFGIIYEFEKIAEGGNEFMRSIIEKAEELKANEVNRALTQKLEKLIRHLRNMRSETQEGEEEAEKE